MDHVQNDVRRHEQRPLRVDNLMHAEQRHDLPAAKKKALPCKLKCTRAFPPQVCAPAEREARIALAHSPHSPAGRIIARTLRRYASSVASHAPAMSGARTRPPATPCCAPLTRPCCPDVRRRCRVVCAVLWLRANARASRAWPRIIGCGSTLYGNDLTNL
jgi:hypothetical protein